MWAWVTPRFDDGFYNVAVSVAREQGDWRTCLPCAGFTPPLDVANLRCRHGLDQRSRRLGMIIEPSGSV
jgi:hypothetical protein